LDLSSLNSSWLAPTGAVVIDGKAIIATGEQNVGSIAGTGLLAGTAAIAQGLEVSGTVAVADVLPGAASVGARVSVTGTLEADIVALLTTADLVPTDPANAKLVGLLSGTQVRLPGASAISGSDFAFVIGVEGSGAQSQLSVSLVGSIEVDDPNFSNGPVTFEAVALTDGTTTTFSGGIKPGSTWRNPLGLNGVVVENARVHFRNTTNGATVGSFSGTMNVGGKTFSIDVESDGTELSLDLKLPRLSVGDVVDVMKSAGVSVGSLHADLRRLTLEPTDLSFSTDAGSLSGALSTGATFRGQTVKVLIAGDTSGSNNLLVALSLEGGGTLGSFLDAPALAAIPIPEGGIVVSRVPFNNLALSSTSIEGAFLTDMFCGAAATGTCTYSVPSGVSFAARAQLPPTILDVLKTFGPIGTDGALRITGRIPVFGDGALDLAVELPAITANANSPVWFDRATLKVEISIEDGSIGFGLVGQMTVNMPDPSDANPDKTQKVSFSIDATIEATPGSVSFTIGGGLTPGTGWDTPFGIDWLDLQALRLEISITVGPNSSVQVGVRAKVRVGPSTFDGSFAIEVLPGGLSFGFRVAADAIELRDLAALAAKMADSPGAFDPSSVPNASLRNVELSFSTIDAPNLCLVEGVKLSADLYLDSPMASAGGSGEEPIAACGGQRSGTAANAACLADDACFARVAFSVSEDGITASAALNELDLGAIVVSDVQIALELTTSNQAFSASGMLSIPGFVDVNGSVEISTNGFAFVVSVKEDPNSGVDPKDLDEFTISASASFGLDGEPPEFHFNMFVRMPSVDDILVDAQKTVADVIEFFVGKENAPDYVTVPRDQRRRCRYLNRRSKWRSRVQAALRGC
ncbi:MAG: hypothetical protein GXP35_08010, partial [Actinobacteria bacterium]|nr:hypothetical protein [Actinomycetota bacterium]